MVQLFISFAVLSTINCVLSKKEVLFSCPYCDESGERSPGGSPGARGNVGPPGPHGPRGITCAPGRLGQRE